LSGGTELAPPTDEVKDSAAPPHPPSPAPEPVPPTDGVGHAMVEGAPEAIDELHEKAEEVDTKQAEDTQPAALDTEVAEVVAKEEAKDDLPPTPSPVRAISPMSPMKEPSPESKKSLKLDVEVDRGDILTPPLPTLGLPDEDGLNVDGESRKRGRSKEPTIPGPTKRQRKTYDTPLPHSLSYLLHPPTSTLYITNLRRPLVHSALHDYLFPTSSPASDRLPPPKPPFATRDHPNLWLSGVKDHAYAAYPSIEAALAEAERIEGQTWPEETGEKLHLEFVPDELVRGLVEREEFAWANGRQKLTLRMIEKDGEVDFGLQGSGAIGRRPAVSRPNPPGVGLARPPPLTGLARPQPTLTGTNAIRPPPGAPTGPAAGVGIGIRGRAVPPHLARPGNGGLPARPVVGRGLRTAEGRLLNPMRRTRVRPGLFWKEGPGAAAAAR